MNLNLNPDYLTAEKLAALADSGTDHGRNPVDATFLTGRLSVTFSPAMSAAREAIPFLIARVQVRMNAWHVP
jgi:hypothetical protein